MPAKITLTPPHDAAHDGAMREKQAERLEEFALERERAILAAHGPPPGLMGEVPPVASSSSAGAEGNGRTGGDGGEEGLKRQVERLQVEMERMRAVQHGLVQEMGEVAPPPVYTETTGH
jgi:hypothetical protein